MPCCSHGTSTALRMNDRLRSAGDVHDRRRADAACAARVIQVAAEPSCRLMRELARRWPGCSDFHRRTRLNRSASVETIAWPSPDVENTTFQDGYGVAHASRDRAPVREARGRKRSQNPALCSIQMDLAFVAGATDEDQRSDLRPLYTASARGIKYNL